MRTGLIVLWMLLFSITSAAAQVSIGIGLPGVTIGINLPVYPQLVRVPGYPVYYAPQMNSNYFFYDGMYWVYDQDNWYASTWYNGPWELVGPEMVPLFILRIPVRYYRQPPSYFRGWTSDAPPRWGEHWGNTWEERRRGWDNWNRASVPQPAPLPVYQRQYSGNKYPPVEQQQALQSRNYRYKPKDALSPAALSGTASAKCASACSAAKSGRTSGKKCPATGPTWFQPAIFTAATGSARSTGTTAAEERSRRSGPGRRQTGSSAGQPYSPTSDAANTARHGPASAAGTQGASPGQGTASQATRAGTKGPAADAATTASHRPASAAGTKAQAQDKGPQGKASAQKPKQGQQKDGAKGEQRDGEGNK